MRTADNGVAHNRRYWDAMFATDPEHTKPFDRAGFKGKAVDPVHRLEKMTATFGPCGIGWGTTKPEYERIGDPLGKSQNVLVYCTIGVWVESRDNIVYGVGGDHVIRVQNNGRVVFDDEAYKKAYTDAITNALLKLGNSADVHLGLHEDNKYVAEVRGQFAEQPASENAPKPVPADKAPSPPKPPPPGSTQHEFADCYGEISTYTLPDEAASVRAAVEHDLSQAATIGGDAVREAWERHKPLVALLPDTSQKALKKKGQELLGVNRRAGKEAVAASQGEPDPVPTVGPPTPPPAAYDMPDIPDYLRREPNGGAQA